MTEARADGKIFINYRREEAKAWSLLLYNALEPVFGEDRLFYDVEHHSARRGFCRLSGDSGRRGGCAVGADRAGLA